MCSQPSWRVGFTRVEWSAILGSRGFRNRFSECRQAMKRCSCYPQPLQKSVQMPGRRQGGRYPFMNNVNLVLVPLSASSFICHSTSAHYTSTPYPYRKSLQICRFQAVLMTVLFVFLSRYCNLICSILLRHTNKLNSSVYCDWSHGTV